MCESEQSEEPLQSWFAQGLLSSTWITQDELKLEKEAGKPLTFEYDDDLPG